MRKVHGTNVDWIWHSAVRVTSAVVVGAVFHAAWVASFIFIASQGASGIVRAMLWLTAPVVTAAGFGFGLTLAQRRDPESRIGFTRAFVTALSGCTIGALVMSPIGPMFVGLGVLSGGALAVVMWTVSGRAGIGQEDAMDDTFQIKVNAAAGAAWWTFLVASAFFFFQWILYLGVMSTQPVWVVSLWGPGATWEGIRTVWFQALVFVKLTLWLLALAALWLTLWAKQLRKRARSA